MYDSFMDLKVVTQSHWVKIGFESPFETLELMGKFNGKRKINVYLSCRGCNHSLGFPPKKC